MKTPDAREIMAFGIVSMFAWSLIQNPHEPLIVGAMIAAFSTAYGFYLGGSKVGSDTATKNADTLAARATEPQPVIVTNPPDAPVQTEDARP